MTTKLPINDTEIMFTELNIHTYSTSYIQGKSLPTTPSLLSRSPRRAGSRTRHHSRQGSATPLAPLPKSKSAVHIGPQGRTPRSGATSPGGQRRGSRKEEPVSARGRTDSDWLLRAGVLISSETRESKGQSWLVSRASSTSLTGMQGDREEGEDDDDDDHDPDMFERERIARENAIASKHASRRGSTGVFEGDESPLVSRIGSFHASRTGSRTGSRTQLITPGERASIEGYFASHAPPGDYTPGPDFVNLDEKLEATGFDGETDQDDEADVRRLFKNGQSRPGTWFGNIFGWTLASVEENDEDDDPDGEDSDGEAEMSTPETPYERQFEGAGILSEQRMPAPKAEQGGWQDAAWLLSVASKVAWS